MTDIDRILDRVRAAPTPSRLAALDGAVLDALAQGGEADGPGARPIAMAAIAALTIGVLGAMPGGEAEAAPMVAPLGGMSSLAPSTLLAGNR